jgi:hypothetical protein
MEHGARQITAIQSLEETEETWSWQEGYTGEQIEEPIFINPEGERFRQKRNVIDYWGGAIYIDEEGGIWHPKRELRGRVIDRGGNPVTKDSPILQGS